MLFGYTPKQFIERIIQEFITPQTSLGKKIKLLFIKKHQTKLKKNLNLNLLYNLDYNSATFDFGYVLLMIDKYAKINKINFNVIIIKRKRKEIKDWYTSFNLEKINKRINNMLVPLAESFTRCNKIIIFENFKDIKKHKNEIFFPYDLKKNIYFFDYKFFYNYLSSPDNYDGIKTKNLFKKEVNNLISVENKNKKKIVTLTIRNYSFEEERNTDPDFWLNVLSYFDHKYYVIVIPDIESLNDQKYYDYFKKYFIFYECAKSIQMKIALYEIANLNFFPHTGNSVLSQLNKNSCSITYLKTFENKKNLNTNYFNKIGQHVGKNYKFLTNRHRICWNSDIDELVKTSNELLN